MGQAEVDVAAATDTAVVVLAPGRGRRRADGEGRHPRDRRRLRREQGRPRRRGRGRRATSGRCCTWAPRARGTRRCCTTRRAGGEGIEELWGRRGAPRRTWSVRRAAATSAARGCCARSRASRPSGSACGSRRPSTTTRRSADGSRRPPHRPVSGRGYPGGDAPRHVRRPERDGRPGRARRHRGHADPRATPSERAHDALRRAARPVYGPEDLDGWDPDEQLGEPGAFPFTRGVYPSMYRGRLWTMRQFAGLRHARRDERALPLPARAGPGRAVGRLRHAHADGPGLRRPAQRGRGRSLRRRHRLARGLRDAVRRHPARRHQRRR